MSREQIIQHIKQRDMIVVSSIFSNCGDYMIAANNHGFINIWYLPETILHHQHQHQQHHQQQHHMDEDTVLLSPSIQQQQQQSNNNKLTNCHYSFETPSQSCINSLLLISNDSVLLSSDDTDILAWNWTDIKKIIGGQLPQQAIQPLFVIPSPQKEGKRGSLSERCEINSMDIDNNGHLYLASGDCNAYSYDLNTLKCVSRYQGHKQYLHSVKWNKRYNSLITSSEDGTVRIWDASTAICQTILCPKLQKSISESDSFLSNHSNSSSSSSSNTRNNNNNNGNGNKNNNNNNNNAGNGNITRDQYWTGPVDIDETGNWLAVGGNMASMWYLGKLNTMSSLLSSKFNESIYSLIFEKDRILTAGTSGYVNYYGLDGKLLMKVPSTSEILYTLSYNPHQRNQILIAGGTSPLINTYINQENIAFSYYFSNQQSYL
ncbi:WD40 repeat-containing protein [Cavenderia fasciculata]|uniref:WD40 repeat-containing protein n=1 Tax=Cavenderia fasciculata TaxID=261658 RepID=F4PI81_CACFS|nr:WD40 repeat-containing protein [Cavenderia fasciculata]EGG25364.1 WD40 repeat-containing protein [Cavenderia fasciculata]|eukprot:XP_004363215.1 WD40 repeat-containing protein [Cavenderia fasciculata]